MPCHSGKYFSIAEICHKYNLKYRSVWNWIQANQLKAIKVNGRIRVSRVALLRLIEGAGIEKEKSRHLCESKNHE
jgi:hypothetical protein